MWRAWPRSVLRPVGVLGLLGALAATAAACGPGAAATAPSTQTSNFMASTGAAGPTFPAGVLTAATLPKTRTGALCGSLLAACPAAEMGHPSASEPKAGTVGGFVELDIHGLFTSPAGAEGSVAQGGPPPKYTPQGWGAPGINGTPYPAQYFPSTGNFTLGIHGLSVTFLIPAEGVGIRSTFDLAAPVDVKVPAGKYRAVWILGNGIGGGAGEVLLVAHYSDGSSAGYAFDLTGWCHPGSLAPGEFPAVLAPYLLQNHGGKMQPAFQGCGGLYAVGVPVDATRTLTSISLPGSTGALLAGGTGGAQNDFVTAISLQQ